MEQIERAELIKMASGTEEEQQQVMQYCYNLIENLIRKYLDLKEEYYKIVTLWIMGTYIHKSFETYPFLFLNAMKSSGKTRLLKLIASLSQEGIMMGLPSEAVIFRTADKSTFCLDENTLILNAEKGYTKIKDIKAGDILFTNRGLDKVKVIWNNGYRENLFQISTSNTFIHCTADHKIFALKRKEYETTTCPLGDWIEAKYLTESDYIFCDKHKIITDFNSKDEKGRWTSLKLPELRKQKITSIKIIPYGRDVYDLTMENEPNFYANGILVHNCLDEFESIDSKEKGFIRELLNAAYKKGQFITRTRKVMTKGMEDYKPVDFPVYAPIAFANINGMGDVLNDRCINLILERSNNSSKTRLSERVGYRKEFREVLETIKLCLNEHDIENMYDGWDYVCLNNDKLKVDSVETMDSCCTTNLSSKQTSFDENSPKQPSFDKVDSCFQKTYIGGSESTLINPIQGFSNTPLTSTLSTLSTTNKYNTFYNILFSSQLDGRPLELFFPILFLASRINNSVLLDLMPIAEDIVAKNKENNLYESNDIMLFDFISKLPYNELDWVSIGKLCGEFKQSMGYDDKFVNPQWVGRALTRLDIRLDIEKKNDGNYVRLKMAYIKERMNMYKSEGKVNAIKTAKEAPRSKKLALMDTFIQLAKESPTSDVMHEEWYSHFKEIYTPDEFDKQVEKIKQAGLIFEPKARYYKNV